MWFLEKDVTAKNAKELKYYHAFEFSEFCCNAYEVHVDCEG
jgi:hypothetical protein